MWAYMKMATDKPRPWQVRPAMMMDMADVSGCVCAITDAIVPESMIGKMGKIQVGIIVCRLKLCLAKMKLYWPMARHRVVLTYIQNKTRIAVVPDVPALGITYFSVFVISVATARNAVGRKKPSREWPMLVVNEPGNK